MRLVADLHVHSRFSRATSPKLRPDYLDRWARIKGVDLIGTGDCTHPAYLALLQDQLEEAEGGFYRLKAEARRLFDAGAALADALPDAGSPDGRPEARFVVTGEISTIYSDKGRTRKVHHLILLPCLEAAAIFQARLERVGNIASDGRPILGLSSRDLFELLLEADERSILVPAHIWTPWFSALGSRSGYDSIDECYGDLASRVGAIETGLSSNPPMNWAVGSLDRFAIVSNSDAHSPDKLGREATMLEIEASYEGLRDALSGAEGASRGRVAGTIEFFPQEGKYHYDGHRACGVVLSPEESARSAGICPSCGRPLTPGVSGRVAELADRPVDEYAACPSEGGQGNRRPYRSLIPLAELLSELIGAGPGSKKVTASYNALVEAAGSELALLGDLDAPAIGAIDAGGVPGPLLAEAIGRMRAGKVYVRPGYDGEYGEIRVFAPGEELAARRQAALFAEAQADDAAPSARAADQAGAPAARKGGARKRSTRAGHEDAAPTIARPLALDAAQLAAAGHGAGPALIVAGPGSGKTAVLARRVARLVEEGTDPSSVLALTFTNKAAGELRSRIAASLGPERAAPLTASTFHSFCLSILRERFAEAGLREDFKVLSEEERSDFLESAALARAPSRSRGRALGGYVEARKRYLLLPGEARARLGPGAPTGLAELAAELGVPALDPDLDAAYAAYRDALRGAGVLDFDDLVAGAVRLLAARPRALAELRRRYGAILVDEYQDVNFAQYALVRMLADDGPAAEAGPTGRSLMVIGDPNQAIYGFRGSDPRFIGRFLSDFPGAKVYRITRSFRCAAPIIGAAGKLVAAELEGAGASVRSAVSLFRREYPTDAAEAEGIAREIDRMIGGTRFFAMDSGVAVDGPAVGAGTLRSLGECAILLRASALAPAIGKALDDHGIPYATTGERPWWEEEPAGSILALLRSERPRLDLSEAVRWASSRLLADGGSRSEKDRAAVDEAAARLISFAASFGGLESFLDALALGSPVDGRESAVAGGSAERVSIMTIHAAKGLEFDHVFVAGLEDGILPFILFDDRDEAGAAAAARIEEERRILYVAMTRARVGLRLSWARSRRFRGRALELPPSRFLAEIGDLVPLEEERGLRRERDPQLGLF